MKQVDEVLELDYDSPLELLFWFLSSFWCIGGSILFVCIVCLLPATAGGEPVWPDFPIAPFGLVVAFLWALGYWLKTNYDVRYQLDSRTQQLNLVRKIFGMTFKSRVADFSELHCSAVMSSFSDGKQGRVWSYAQCLVTRSARIVRVSSYTAKLPRAESDRLAKTLGVISFPSKERMTLAARCGRSGEVKVAYEEPAATSPMEHRMAVGGLVFLVGIILVLYLID